MPRRIEKWADMPVVDWEIGRVDMLLGCNVPDAHWIREHRVDDRQGPYAVHTVLGWIRYGPTGEKGLVSCVSAQLKSIEG